MSITFPEVYPAPARSPIRAAKGARNVLAQRAAAALLFCAATVGFAVKATPAGGEVAGLHPRGVMVDIGGRRLRIVCEGPKDAPGPTVVFESGAYGFSGDWAYSQAMLTAQGVRSCAYDRAGMGMSDPSSLPRDGVNVARDLEKLLVVAKVPAPYVLVGHSMAGARVHLFANRNPDKVAGLVLVDSTTPDSMSDPAVQKDVNGFIADTHMAKITGELGILRWLEGAPFADKVGLPGEEDKEKRAQFGSKLYARTAWEEASNWPLAARQAAATGPLNTAWPVAVVSAGVHDSGEGPQLVALQAPPALASVQGHVEVVAGATHNGLLGAKYAPAIVRGVDFVLNAARGGSPLAPQRFADARASRPSTLTR